mmetsp:Transcript_12921/g.23290  ORF Transcript_12921/g.23290 Transcript_12921/m.23290 type:complete len:447 (+) Transcript_12921:47-1387(+)
MMYKLLACLLLAAQTIQGLKNVTSREPTFQEERTIVVNDKQIKAVVATFYLEYELAPGEILYTVPTETFITSLKGKFAVLAQTGFRNIHAGTNTSVSLDEAYVHHVAMFPGIMNGAEGLTPTAQEVAQGATPRAPYFEFEAGYGFIFDQQEFGVNAHVLSNVDLAPVHGSMALARKHCNECWYAPGKGSGCTPELSGAMACCGETPQCIGGEEDCRCKTTSQNTTKRRYELQFDFLITRQVEDITPLAQWTLTAPQCNPTLEPLPKNSACFLSAGMTTSGSMSYLVHENNTEPEKKTVGRWISPASGEIHWAKGHLHTGGVNISLSINGKKLCTSTTVYGNDPNVTRNARDEFGHLVEITDCIGSREDLQSVRIQAGDVIEVDSFYYVGKHDSRLPHRAGGSHFCVMSYMLLGVVFDKISTTGSNSLMSILNLDMPYSNYDLLGKY